MSNRKKSARKPALKAPSAHSNPSVPPLGVRAGVALIAVAVLLAYFPSISGGFLFDDNLLLTNNKLIKASDGLYRIWFTTEALDYWPVTNTTLWFEWRLWGMNSTGYHVTNLILHVVEALLIWIILRKLSIPGAFPAAMIFAVHPVNVESVAWIAQRKNMMAMLFFLLSILCYLKMETASSALQNGLKRIDLPLVPRRWPLWYWLSLAAFVLAMLSKGSVAILPVLLLGIIWWLRPLKMRDLVRTAPFFLVAIVMVIVNVAFQKHVVTEGPIRIASFTERLLGAGGVVWFYLYKALLPIDLAFVYPLSQVQSANPLWWLALFAALAVTAILWLYRKSWSRPVLFAWVFFCVALVPVMGFTDVAFMLYSLVADHYQHIAIIGAIALVAAGWSIWHRRAQKAARRAAMAVAIVAVAALAFLTWRQSGIYRNAIVLYEAALEKNPDCWFAQNNLGSLLLDLGQVQKAMPHFVRSFGINPYNVQAYNNMGLALVRTNKPREAIEYYEKALQIKPNFPDAHYNMGFALVQTDRPREAIEHYEKAIQLKPDYPEAENNLGLTLVIMDRQQDAIKHYEQALHLRPDYYEALLNLGNALMKVGKLPEAIEHFQQVLRLRSDCPDGYNNLAIALNMSGRRQEAIEYYQKALRLSPDFTEIYFNLALLYAKTNQSAEAIATAREGLRIAQSKGQTGLAKQIEDWLNSYRTGLTDLPNASPSSESPPPLP